MHRKFSKKVFYFSLYTKNSVDEVYFPYKYVDIYILNQINVFIVVMATFLMTRMQLQHM